MHRTMDIAYVKKEIQSLIGKKLKAVTNRGRASVRESTVIITAAYPNMFLLEHQLPTSTRRESFSYVDVMTQQIQLTRIGGR
jgi:uncharacterized protein Veg